jgi:periplasmic divalent cation tolerance protein
LNTQPLLVLTTVPDSGHAEAIARRLVAERCAACVTIGAPVRSLYHWRGKIETADELPLTIKTTAGCYDMVERLVRELHPYELPEIIAVPITGGLAPYLDWIAAETDRSKAATIVA